MMSAEVSNGFDVWLERELTQAASVVNKIAAAGNEYAPAIVG